MVASAAYDALMKFDQQLQLGMQRYLQRINYVNLDTEMTAFFIQAFSRSTSGDRVRNRAWREAAAAASDVTVRDHRRSKSLERQPAKQVYVQSTRQDADDFVVVRRDRRRRDDNVRLSAPTAAQSHNELALRQTYSGRGTKRTRRQASSQDTRYVT